MVNQKYESLVETLCWHFSPIFKLKSTLSFDFDLAETKILSYTLLMVEYDNNQQSKIVGIARLIKTKEMRGFSGSCSQTLFNVASNFFWTHMMVKMVFFLKPFFLFLPQSWRSGIWMNMRHLFHFHDQRKVHFDEFLPLLWNNFSKVYGANLPSSVWNWLKSLYRNWKNDRPGNLHHTLNGQAFDVTPSCRSRIASTLAWRAEQKRVML